MRAGPPDDGGKGGRSVVVIVLRIGSRREFLDPIHGLTERILRRAGFGDDDCYWMVTAVREAVSNALLHGNRERPDTHVDIRFEMHRDGIAISVWDQGEGFDPEDLPDPLSEEHLLDSSGRGVYLMNQLMDEVTYSFPEGGGTCLLMKKSLQGAPRPSS